MESFAYILIVIFSMLLIFFFVMMGFALKSALQAYETGAILARDMGLTPVSEATRPSLAWFEGRHNERPFAIRIAGKYMGRGIENRRSYATVLRIAVAVQTKKPPGFKAKYDKKNGAIRVYDVQHDYENNEVFTRRSSTAFWDFVHRGYPIGFQDGDLRFTRGTRELVFGERKALDSPYLFGKTVLTDAPVVLVHDHIRPNRAADQVQILLDELIQVAKVIEQEY